MRLDAAGGVLERGRARETRCFDGREFLLETALTGDVAILRAWKADRAGNCVFRCVGLFLFSLVLLPRSLVVVSPPRLAVLVPAS